MIKGTIVMKSGAIVETIFTTEEKYLAIAEELLTSEEPLRIDTEGFFSVFINSKEVAAISAELLEEDDEEEASGDDEASVDDEDNCAGCCEVFGSEACVSCHLESPNT